MPTITPWILDDRCVIFDHELVNANQGITTSLSAISKPFTQFEAYYVMSDMNWHDCIKSHHKVQDKLKHVQKKEKKRLEKLKKRKRKRNLEKFRRIEKDRIEKEVTKLFQTSLNLISFVWRELTGLFETSSDLSSFVGHILTRFLKTSLDLSSICLILRQVRTCLVFVWCISPWCEIGVILYDANWRDCFRQVWTCQVFVWCISPWCEIGMILHDANWQDCYRQVETCPVFVWYISPCCEIDMM